MVRVVVRRALSASINLKKKTVPAFNFKESQSTRGKIAGIKLKGLEGLKKKSSSTLISGAVMGSLCHMTNKEFILAV